MCCVSLCLHPHAHLNSGQPIPRIQYTPQEVEVWRTVLAKLHRLFPTHACAEFNQALPLFDFRWVGHRWCDNKRKSRKLDSHSEYAWAVKGHVFMQLCPQAVQSCSQKDRMASSGVMLGLVLMLQRPCICTIWCLPFCIWAPFMHLFLYMGIPVQDLAM
jgi:hypothetical protein